MSSVSKEDAAAAENSGAEGKKSTMHKFKEGEKVLAFHGPLIYEAKIQRLKAEDNELRYFVHYLGWSKNWDEWIGEDRVLPLNEENLQRQKLLTQTQAADKRGKGRTSQSKQQKGSTGSGAKGKKRKSSEEKDSDDTDSALKFSLPAALKRQLIEDCELVTQGGKLIKLPKNPSVEEILKKYHESKNNSAGDSFSEILSGLRSYFDNTLSTMLLYKEERKQHAELFSKSTLTPSSVYGAEHFLRLFVKLPDLLQHVNLEEEAFAQLQQKLMDLLKYIQKNQSSLFNSNSENPKSENK